MKSHNEYDKHVSHNTAVYILTEIGGAASGFLIVDAFAAGSAVNPLAGVISAAIMLIATSIIKDSVQDMIVYK